MNPVSNIAQGALRTPNNRTIELANDWVPLECSKTAPKIAPMPMIVAMNPSALPMLLTIVSATCVNETASGLTQREVAATTTETKINAKNACILNRKINTNSSAIPNTNNATNADTFNGVSSAKLCDNSG